MVVSQVFPRVAWDSGRATGSFLRYRDAHAYSYADAGEAVLVRYLTEQGLRPKDVRHIVENLREEYGAWPLAYAPLHHDGKLVVVRKGRDIYISALRRGHEVIAGTLIDLKAVRAALERGGWVALESDRKHIAVDPEWLSGRPTIRGRRIATETVAELATRSEGHQMLLDDFGLTEEEIAEAVEYEDDVQKAIAA